MQGVQGADRLARELAAGSIQDLLMELQLVPMPACPGQRSTAINDITFLEPFHYLRSDQYTVDLDEGNDRREYLLGPGKLPSDLLSSGLTQQPGENRARLSVQPHRVPRSALSSFADVVDRSRRDKDG